MPLSRVPAASHRAAWLTDPLGRHELRYWDGEEWTAHVSDAGIPATDSLIALPAIAVTLPVPTPTGPLVPAMTGDDVVPRQGAPGPSATTARRGLWPWLLAAAAVVLVVVAVVAVRSGSDAPAPPLRRVVGRVTPTTTLPVSECQRIVLQVQAGVRTMGTLRYRHACGAVPAGIVLGATTTTTAPAAR